MRVQFGTIVTAGAGKAGGQIIQRGRTGQILRNLTKPKTRSTYQAARPRTTVSYVSAGWRSITSAQRTSWNVLASGQTRYNKFGVSYAPTGYQLFCELNLNLLRIPEVPYLDDAPTLIAFPSADNWSLSSSGLPATYSIDWDFVADSASWRVLVSLFNLQSRGVSVPRGNALLLPETVAITAETFDITSYVNARFTENALANQTLWARVQLMETSCGLSTAPFDLFISQP